MPDLDAEDPFAQLFNGGSPPSADGSDVFLAAALDKKEAYLGQQVVYAIKLYTRTDVNEFNDLKLPGFDGFWGEDLETPTHPRPQLQTVGGSTYQVFLLKKRRRSFLTAPAPSPFNPPRSTSAWASASSAAARCIGPARR